MSKSSPEGTQVQGIPMHGPGAKKLQKILVDVTATSVKSTAETKFDPILPSEGPILIESFCSSSSSMIAVVGVLCIVYGVVAK